MREEWKKVEQAMLAQCTELAKETGERERAFRNFAFVRPWLTLMSAKLDLYQAMRAEIAKRLHLQDGRKGDAFELWQISAHLRGSVEKEVGTLQAVGQWMNEGKTETTPACAEFFCALSLGEQEKDLALWREHFKDESWKEVEA
jgi:hypothetical protein